MKTVLLIMLAVGLSLTVFGQDSVVEKGVFDSTLFTKQQDQKVSHCFPTVIKDNRLNIVFSKEKCGEVEITVKVYNLVTGKIIFEKKFMNEQIIETNDWPRGMSMVFIQHHRGYERNKIFIQ